MGQHVATSDHNVEDSDPKRGDPFKSLSMQMRHNFSKKLDLICIIVQRHRLLADVSASDPELEFSIEGHVHNGMITSVMIPIPQSSFFGNTFPTFESIIP